MRIEYYEQDILRKIKHVVDEAEARGREVRRLYLTPAEHDQLIEEYGTNCTVVFGVEIRRGKETDHGETEE